MDDERRAVTHRMAVVVTVFALAVLAGVQAAGEHAVAPLLLLALLAVGYLAYGELSGRPARGRTAAVEVPQQRESEWYSERWVQENVRRGLRSLEEWRREQSSS